MNVGRQLGLSAFLTIWLRLLCGCWVISGGSGLLAAGEGFVTAGSVVVVLPGLPGDVASETGYRQQLQGWLDWLGKIPAAPSSVVVFWDDEQSLNVPPKLAVKRLPARRESFLALGKTLAGQTRPLVAILWGHGGKQGQTPVFHVRGPRITPADLQSFADQAAGGESRWVLYFRGSGEFAGKLTGARRQIISSDRDSVFAHDPMGLPLLLEAVQANPAHTFLALSGKLGSATARWYEDRRLARTEEPTLWLPEVAPKRLVSEGNAVASSAATKPPKDSTPPAEAAATPPAPPEKPSDGLPAAWRDITRVDPRNYPDADAVVLRRQIRYTLGDHPAIASEHEQFLQILTAEGKPCGDFNVTYSPPQEELDILDAEVLSPDGKLSRLAPADIRDAGDAPTGDYRTDRRKFFSLPGMVPGAVLRVHYRTLWDSYPMPHPLWTVLLGCDTPVIDLQVEVTVPRDSAFHYAFERSAAVDPLVHQTLHGTTYSWHFKDQPAIPAEALMPPYHRPALMVSTFPDWRTVADWYGRITRLANEPTPELAATARELTRDAKTDRDKVRAVYGYVTGLRYVAVPLGINSFRPHAAAGVLENQFGDCKDKANLFNTLLGSLGIKACLVLVPRFARAHDAVPGLAFNHAISRVTLNGESLWVDTTDDVCRFGMLPPGDAGRKVLVIDGSSTTLTELPMPATRDHRLEVRTRMKCPAGGEPAAVSIDAKASGFVDYDFRETARVAQVRRGNAPLLAADFRLSAGTFGLTKQRATPASKLDEDFAWQADGECGGLISVEPGQWRIRAPFWLPRQWELALHRRTQPLYLNQGYPLILDQEVVLALPAGGKPPVLPALQESPGEPLPWKIEWTQPDGQSVRARLHVELPRAELDAAEALRLQNQLRGLLESLGQGVMVEMER